MKEIESKKLSLQGAAGDVAISCDKALSLRGAKGDVAIPRVKALSLRGGLMSDEAIFHAETNSVQRLLSWCCKNVEDCRVSAMHFLAMTPTTIALAAVLSVGIASKALAECVGATETTAGIDSVTKAHCGICGTNCNWKIEDSTLKVTGGSNGEIGTMDGYSWKTVNGVYGIYDSSGNSRPWAKYKDQIKKVDIQGVENVAPLSFHGFTNVTDIKLSDSITKIDQYAFASTNVKTVVLPDSLTSLGYRAFSEVYNSPLEQIVIPDSLNLSTKGNSHFGDDPVQLSNLKIICLGDKQKCQNLLSDYSYWSVNGSIPFNLAGNVVAADYKYCNSTNYYWDGANCIREPDVTKRKCCDSCKDMGGYCNRIRYTPAEAAQILKDTDNQIIMTFKVNR